MTKIKCSAKWQRDPLHPCQFIDENGICDREEIEVRNGEEGYALFKACCETIEPIENIKCPTCNRWNSPLAKKCELCQRDVGEPNNETL